MKLDDIPTVARIANQLEEVNAVVANLIKLRDSDLLQISIESVGSTKITCGAMRRTLQEQRQALANSLKDFGVQVDL